MNIHHKKQFELRLFVLKNAGEYVKKFSAMDDSLDIVMFEQEPIIRIWSSEPIEEFPLFKHSTYTKEKRPYIYHVTLEQAKNYFDYLDFKKLDCKVYRKDEADVLKKLHINIYKTNI